MRWNGKEVDQGEIAVGLRNNLGKAVTVRGMWTGDFIGEVLYADALYAEFRIRSYMDRRDLHGDPDPAVGEAISFPICVALDVEVRGDV